MVITSARKQTTMSFTPVERKGSLRAVIERSDISHSVSRTALRQRQYYRQLLYIVKYFQKGKSGTVCNLLKGVARPWTQGPAIGSPEAETEVRRRALRAHLHLAEDLFYGRDGEVDFLVRVIEVRRE